jgi:hypothetical protein
VGEYSAGTKAPPGVSLPVQQGEGRGASLYLDARVLVIRICHTRMTTARRSGPKLCPIVVQLSWTG